MVEEEETEGVFRLRSKSARRLWYSGSVIVLVSFLWHASHSLLSCAVDFFGAGDDGMVLETGVSKRCVCPKE